MINQIDENPWKEGNALRHDLKTLRHEFDGLWGQILVLENISVKMYSSNHLAFKFVFFINEMCNTY